MRRIAAGFPQDQLTEPVVVCVLPARLFQDQGARNVAHAPGDDPHRDAGMGIDGGDPAFEGHLCPPLAMWADRPSHLMVTPASRAIP